MGDLFDHLIHFILAHNEAVVQWMFLLVVATGAVLLGTSIFSRPAKEEDASPGATTGGVGMGSAEMVVMSAEVAKLKLEVEQRTTELTAVKAQAAQAQAAGADTSKFEERIKELEGKLVEYEILEDDIADLSLYKAENAQLKAELSRLGGTAPAPASGPASDSAPSGSMEAVASETVATEVFAEPAEEAPVPQGLSGVEPPPKANEDLVEEFASVVEESKKVSDEPAEPESDVDVDDLLNEFAASLNEDMPKASAPTKAPTPVVAQATIATAEPSDLDTDKMLAEAAALEEQAGNDPGLDEETDMEKMAAEASKLLGN